MTTDTRIESLETQVRTLKRMLFGVFGLVVVAGLLAATSLQSVPDVVRAKKFEVVDTNGDAVTVLDSNLRLSTPGGMVRVVNGGFVVSNEKGRELLQLQSNSSTPTARNAGELVLMTADGTQFISLGYVGGDESKPGSGVIRSNVIRSDTIQSKTFVAFDDKGDAYAVINKDKQEVPWIGIVDDGGGIAVLSANDHGGVLQISESSSDDKDWKVVAKIDVNEDGGGQVVTHDSKGKTTSETP